MHVTNITTSNQSFKGRNPSLKQADKILRKINKDFPSVSPWHADYRAFQSDKIKEAQIAAKWSSAKLNAFRDAQESVINKNYLKYISCLIEGIRRYKVANCKELSEIAYLIAKTNGIEDCYCANLYLKNNKNKRNVDIEHSIFIISPKQPKSVGYADPYYVDKPAHSDLFEPMAKSIVIDPTFGFVDFWQNARKIYQNMGFINPKNNEDLAINLRKPLFKNENEIQKFQIDYPILSMNANNSNCESKYNFKVADIALEIYKTTTKNLIVNDYPAAEKFKINNKITKKNTLLERVKNMILSN